MDIVSVILGIFSGGSVLIGLKLGLAAVLIGGVVWLLTWIDRQALDQSKKNTSKDRTDTQSGIDDSGKQIFDDAKKSEKDIEDIINKKG